MLSRMPRWLLITLLALAVLLLATGLFFLIRWNPLVGWIVTGVIVGLLIVAAIVIVPQLVKLYKFNKYFKEHETSLNALPSLMQAGRTQEALSRFDSVMKDAPESAYFLYMKAHLLQAAGKLPEAVTTANRALGMAGTDPYLLPMLQQVDGQMGQPTTVEGFKEQLREMIATLEPRLAQARIRHERAVKDRKKKSR